MANSARPPGEQAHTFPPCAHDVALAPVWGDRWGRQYARGGPSALLEPGDFSLRVRPVLSLLAASLIAAMPMHAMAQEIDRSASVRERPRAEYDPLGLRFGAFNLHASLDLAAGATDNIFATETGAQSDTVFTIGPRARLTSDWVRHQVMVEAGAEFANYSDFSSEDHETGYLGAAARLDVGRDTRVRFDGRISEEVEPRTDPDALTFGGPVEYSRRALGAEIEHTLNRIRLRGRVATVEYDYDDVGAIDQDFRDSTENSLGLRVDAEIAPRIGVLFEAIADERELKNLPTLNSEGRTYRAGLSVSFTDVMYGEFAIGQFERDYDYGGSVDGTAIAARLEWNVTQMTTLNFSADRSVEDTGATVGLPYVQTQYRASVDHELLRNLIVSAGVSAGERDYEIVDRTDEFIAADVGLDYLVNRRVVLYGRYRFDSQDSSGFNRYRDYDVNTALIGVRLRL